MLSPSASQTHTPSAEEIHRILEDLTAQPLLHGSEALCNLLRYLVERSLHHPEHPAKEHQIATEVFGRPATFDPRVDSTVRVQTSRLRSKLTEYYATAGAAQRWQIEIPKGSYTVLFHERATPEQQAPAAPLARTRSGRTRVLLAAGAVIVLLAILLPTTVLRGERQPALERFWGAVLSTSVPPLIVYSNAEFVGRPETGLRYYNPKSDPTDGIFDQYTGVGEVMAVYHLHDTFQELGRHFLLKRGRLLNWDDTKERDVIFLGSPAEDLPLRELPPDHDFTFRRVPGPVGPADLGLINLHPRPGEKAIYFGSKKPPITEDYALIEFSSTAWSHHMLMLAGTTTFGTQAAAEFVCREDKLASLLSYFKKHHRPIGPFSAVLHVTITGEVPLNSNIVAFRFD